MIARHAVAVVKAPFVNYLWRFRRLSTRSSGRRRVRRSAHKTRTLAIDSSSSLGHRYQAAGAIHWLHSCARAVLHRSYKAAQQRSCVQRRTRRARHTVA